MRLDIALTGKMIMEAYHNERRTSSGHVGTHIDLKGKTFDDCTLKAIVFKVPDDTVIADIDLSEVKEGYFVMFNTGHIDKYLYGTKEYDSNHSILSDELIERLIERKIRLIGIDGPGIKKGPEHPLTDTYLSERDIFVVENLCNLDKLEEGYIYDISIKAKAIQRDGMPVKIEVNDIL